MHLKEKSLNILSVKMSERKYCNGCQFMQKLEKFEEGYKTCNTCREKKVRLYQRDPEKHNERTNNYKANNPEKVKEWRQNRMSRIKDEIFTCPVCNYEIKKYKFKQHEQSQIHQKSLKQMQ